MTIRQLPAPRFRAIKSDGTPLSGGKVYTYEPGTSTLKNTFTTSAGDVANANPVILDSRGEAEIWWDGNYKVVVTDAADVTLFTVDNYGTGAELNPSAEESLVPNGSFEDATADPTLPDRWTITLYTAGVVALDTTTAGTRHGSKALKFTSVGTGGGFAVSEKVPVLEGKEVPIIVAMKSSVAGVRNVIEALWYDAALSLISTTTLLDDSTTNQTSWADEDFNATPPANARWLEVRLTGCHSSDATVGSTWFDDVRVGLDFHKITETLSNKTIVSPIFTGTVTGLSLADGQIVFPATQNPSTDPNTFDDYEEGTFTPTVTFATPGDLSVAYTQNGGRYAKIGQLIDIALRILTSTFTHTTASGNLRVQSLPFTSLNATGQPQAPMTWSGITKAGFMSIHGVLGPNTTILEFQASGTGVSISSVTASDTPSGGTLELQIGLTYRATA